MTSHPTLTPTPILLLRYMTGQKVTRTKNGQVYSISRYVMFRRLTLVNAISRTFNLTLTLIIYLLGRWGVRKQITTTLCMGGVSCSTRQHSYVLLINIKDNTDRYYHYVFIDTKQCVNIRIIYAQAHFYYPVPFYQPWLSVHFNVGLFTKVNINFLIVGHTHNLVDQTFASITFELRRSASDVTCNLPIDPDQSLHLSLHLSISPSLTPPKPNPNPNNAKQ